MCYGCTYCNKCGKVDRMRAAQNRSGERVCRHCGTIALDDEIVCSECGKTLPPLMPAPPGSYSA